MVGVPKPDIEGRLRDLGGFIRDQRQLARLSVRKLSSMAGISNPYLSQIERGLRKPSADILQKLARGLQISAETLYEQAGFLDRKGGPDVVAAVMADDGLSDQQKQALVQIYNSYHGDLVVGADADSGDLEDFSGDADSDGG